MAAVLACAVALAVAPAALAQESFTVVRASASGDSSVTFTTDDVSGNFVDPDERDQVGQREPVRPRAECMQPASSGQVSRFSGLYGVRGAPGGRVRRFSTRRSGVECALRLARPLLAPPGRDRRRITLRSLSQAHRGTALAPLRRYPLRRSKLVVSRDSCLA